MSDPELAAEKITALSSAVPVQYGQSIQVRPTSVPDFAAVARDCVRWTGKSESDIQPMRVYLGPWQPKPGCPGAPGGPFSYQPPTPWQEPEPLQYDGFPTVGAFGFKAQIFARVSFGAGGVQHQAYIDWPARGLLLQVSAQYIQVDGVGNVAFGGFGGEERLPLLLAHVAPEPGGGDSVQPATFTYPPQAPAGFNDITFFQVPPFGRAFVPLLHRPNLIVAGITTIQIRETMRPLGDVISVWEFNTAIGNPWPQDNPGGLPLSSLARVVDIRYFIGNVAQPILTPPGCMFHLDL
jgi:hypothetical protein